MEGREVKEEFIVTISPEKVYGLIQEGETQLVRDKYLQNAKQLKGKLRAGMVANINTEQE